MRDNKEGKRRREKEEVGQDRAVGVLGSCPLRPAKREVIFTPLSSTPMEGTLFRSLVPGVV